MYPMRTAANPCKNQGRAKVAAKQKLDCSGMPFRIDVQLRANLTKNVDLLMKMRNAA